MQVESIPLVASHMPRLAPRAPAQPRRLWIPVILVTVFWAMLVLLGRIDKPYFVGFLYSMASAALLVLLYSIWWWTNLSLRLSRRVLGCAMVVGTGLIAALFAHKT